MRLQDFVSVVALEITEECVSFTVHGLLPSEKGSLCRHRLGFNLCIAHHRSVVIQTTGHASKDISLVDIFHFFNKDHSLDLRCPWTVRSMFHTHV